MAFNLTEWAAGVAIMVYAFRRGGIGMVGILSLVLLIPAAVLGPLGSVLGDRYRRDRVLVGAYAALACMTGLTALAMFADLALPVVFLVGGAGSWLLSLVRPIHSSVLPWVARDPEELSIAYAASSLIESASIFLGPLTAGVVLALGERSGVSGPALVNAILALFLTIATVLVALNLRGAAADGARIDTVAERDTQDDRALRELSEGFVTVWRDPRLRTTLTLIGLGWFTFGVLDTAMVALAFDVLHTGDAGVGFLNAALGVGTHRRRGRGPRPSLPGLVSSSAFRTGVFFEGLPVIGIGIAPILAAPLLALTGSGGQLTDTTGAMMLQRIVPDRKLSRVFGVLESVFTAPEGIGGFVGAILIATVGLGPTLMAVGLLVPIAGLLGRRRIAATDVGMRDTAEEVAFLRRNPIFAPLPTTTLDLLARNAVPHVVDADDLIIREGDRGDRFFMIERGEVEVTQDGSAISRLGEGASFGEIALLDDVPRTATVRAVVQTRLLTLDREDFLLALSGHPDAGHEARAVAQERSDRRPEDRPTP